MKKFSKKFKNGGASNEEALQARNWSVDLFSDMAKDPTVLFIDLRKAGSYRGGAEANGISQTYHQGHFRLALNLDTSEIQTVEQLEEEIEMGNNSAVGPIKEAIYLAIVSNFHILLYNQDGMDLRILELFIHSSITWQGERLTMINECIHWLDGGYGALMSKSSTRKLCFDTKTLISGQIEHEDADYSMVHPLLYVGGSATLEHLDVLRERGVRLIVNISNIDEPPPNFEYKYIYANDDHTEKLSRIFYESADLIDNAIKEKKGVFVHCQRGLSRSPTLVMAYLMIKERVSLRMAYELVKHVRPNIGPRNNFMTELCLLERKLYSDGVHLSGYNSKFVYSLPIQLYAISNSNCGDYEANVHFLFGKKSNIEECSIF